MPNLPEPLLVKRYSLVNGGRQFYHQLTNDINIKSYALLFLVTQNEPKRDFSKRLQSDMTRYKKKRPADDGLI